MAESTINNEDYEALMSPDIFDEFESEMPLSETSNREADYLKMEVDAADVNEPEPAKNVPAWKGVSMNEIHKNLGPFGYHQHPPIRPSEHHTALFQLPLPNKGPPRPYPSQPIDKWCADFVRMPNSPHCLYPIEEENKPKELRQRWEIIQVALLQSFVSIAQLEAAIFSYNSKYATRWNFKALHNFFTEVMDEDEAKIFYDKLLPKMVQLALQLPALVTGGIPLLKQHKNASISFSQLQIASLLANAFFCTFPRRNSTNPESEYGSYPYINFNRLFSAYKEDKLNRSASVIEKFKCLFHYFRRVTTSAPEGTVTIQRHYIPKEDCPRWDTRSESLPPLHITSNGTIETEGTGLLQVDFANKLVGGGVLNWGCVQEEIRFIICPELIITRLVAEVLDDTEALIITGAECYCKYEGYSDAFKWAGDFVDETPRDSSGRRKTSIVAMDATRFMQADKQFLTKNIIRELNKAYVGFSSSEVPKSDLPAIATGNWGCGAFRGDPKLKVLIQLMGASVAGRPLVYVTFGDKDLRDNIADMYWHLIDRAINVGKLFIYLRAYENDPRTKHLDLYQFLYDREKINTLTNYFPTLPAKKFDVAKLKKKKVPETSKKPIIQQTYTKIEKIQLADEVNEEKIEKLLEDCKENDDKSTKENKIKTEVVTTKKKPSLWDIFAEKESERDREKVRTSSRLQAGLELLETQTESYNDSIDAHDNDKYDIVPSTSDKLNDELIINMNKSDEKIELNDLENTPVKSYIETEGQKKISDYFSVQK